MKKTLTIIIPCYNEEEVLPLCYERVSAMLTGLKEHEGVESWMLFVNDGSKDRTPQLLHRYAQEDSRIQVVHLSRNFGHQVAVTAGMRHCKTEYAAIIDADMQDPPEVIPEMWRKMLEEDVAVVYGVRRQRDGETWMKKWTAKVFYRFLNSMTDHPFPVDTGDFRLINQQVLRAFNALPEHNKYVRGIISWLGFPQAPLYYDRQERAAGSTKYTLGRMIGLAMDALQYFSKKPLRVATRLGFISVGIGVLLALWVLLGKIFGFTYPASGWSSIMIVVIFFGGLQLLTIGVMSKYIEVIFDEVKGRPEYVVALTENIIEEEEKGVEPIQEQ
ncbi:MAG: glycosyltransferase family 2 protein [Porphyromonas sp.]|nr:glycosyltransferase family 2 protein [Porphyromonas sp.]